MTLSLTFGRVTIRVATSRARDPLDGARPLSPSPGPWEDCRTLRLVPPYDEVAAMRARHGGGGRVA